MQYLTRSVPLSSPELYVKKAQQAGQGNKGYMKTEFKISPVDTAESNV
jgi:hypothetical protein